MKALIFGGGFITGAVSMLAVVLWILSDREKGMVDMTFDGPAGSGRIRGWLEEWPNG